MIRIASIDDVDLLIEMVRSSYNDSIHRNKGFSDNVVRDVILHHIESDNGLCVVYEGDEQIEGMLLVGIKQHLYNTSQEAYITLLYMMKPFRSYKKVSTLIKCAEYWSKSIMNCERITLGNPMIEGLDKLYKRKDYVQVEELFTKEL